MNMQGWSVPLSWLARKRLLGVAVLGVALALAVVVAATGPEAEPAVPSEKAWPVSVTVAEPRRLPPTLVAFGRVESRQVASLKTSISAVVDEVLTPEGAFVRQGELLVRMQTRELQLAVNRAEAEHKRRLAVLTSVRNDFAAARRMTEHHRRLKEIADAKLARHEELYNGKMISSAIIDEVRHQASERAIALETHLAELANFPALVEQHEAMVAESAALLEASKLDLAQAEIRAPFDGRVIATMVAPGDRILPGTVLVTIADLNELEVRVSMPATAAARLREDLRGASEVSAVGHLDGRDIQLELVRLSGDVKPGQSGIDAFFRPVDDHHLDTGRVMDIQVRLPAVENVIAVPVQSLYESDRLYKVEDSRLVGIDARRVGDYITPDGEFQVLVASSELYSGDKVITTQLPRAITGLLVAPVTGQPLGGAIAAQPST